MRRLWVIGMVGFLALLFSRCGKGADGIAGARTAVATVAVILSSDVVLLGDTTSARVEVRDRDHHLVVAPQISWKTADPLTAEVSIQGIVSGMGMGATEIRATVDGVTGSGRIYVFDSTTSVMGPAVDPQPPRDSIDVSWRPATGRTLTVRRGDNLQRALDQASRGDEVVLEAGAEFSGKFELRPKPGSASDGWVTVRTSAIDRLPPVGNRIDPTSHAQHMPKLVSPDDGPALSTDPGASGWRIVGLEITVDPNLSRVQQGLVLLGDGSGAQRSPAQVPSDIILDRVFVHGQARVNLKRCVALNSARTAIVGSQLLQCHGKGFDSQAIAGWNGPGPYHIENNKLEAAGEVIMFGGADPAIVGLVPSDIIVRRNYLYRPLSWRGAWTIKNLFELKNAQRLIVEGNVMENNWVDGQMGFAVVIGSVNQDGGCGWCVAQDVLLQYNYIHNSAGGFNIFERYANAQSVRRVAVRHNLMTNIGESSLGMNGRMFQIGGKIDDLAIENNTGFAPRIYITFGDEVRKMARFSFRNNVGGEAEYPVHGSQANNAQAIVTYLDPHSRFERNVIITQLPARLMPPNNSYVTSRNAVGLDDGNAGLAAWRLSRDSRFYAYGSGASTPGVNIDALLRQLSGVSPSFEAAARRQR